MDTCTGITVLAALLTPTIAVFGSIIAYRQWSTAQNKLKLDLFEKRFAVFAATRKLLSEIANEEESPVVKAFQYRASIAEVSFLFEPDIEQFIEEIITHAGNIHAINQKLLASPADEQRIQLSEQKSVEIIWVINQVPLLTSKFATYLKIRV